VFVGTKMVLVDVYKLPALVSLAVIVGILGLAIGASLVVDRRRSTHVLGEVTPAEAADIRDHVGGQRR
jgi:hypothetical protein